MGMREATTTDTLLLDQFPPGEGEGDGVIVELKFVALALDIAAMGGEYAHIPSAIAHVWVSSGRSASPAAFLVRIIAIFSFASRAKTQPQM